MNALLSYSFPAIKKPVKMWWSFFFASLILYMEVHAGVLSKPIEGNSILEQTESFIELKCLRNADSNAFEDLKTAAKHFRLYTPQTVPKSHAQRIHFICTEVRQTTYDGMLDVLEKLQPCLDLEERYFQDFLLRGRNATFEKECKDDIRLLDVLTTKRECDPGLLDMILQNCGPKINILSNLQNPDYIWVKSDLCSDLETAKACINYEVNLNCNITEIPLLTSVFDSFMSTCG